MALVYSEPEQRALESAGCSSQEEGQAPLRCERHVWPFSQFAADAAANALPQFSFVVTTSRTALTPARRARQMADPRDG
jgi:hypothetical protein